MRAASKNDLNLTITLPNFKIFQENLFYSLNTDKLRLISKGAVTCL